MEVIYAKENFPIKVTKTLFLAGPTPRDENIQSWRSEALKELKKQGYDGVVFVPEPKNGIRKAGYDEQVIWENAALHRSDVILFWIPRNMKDAPGLTTNDEWGYWKAVHPTKLVLGIPDNAERVNYQKFYAKKFEIDIVNSLHDAAEKVIYKIGPGLERSDQQCFFPLDFWKNKSFIRWVDHATRDTIISVDTIFTLKSKVKNSKCGKLSLFAINVCWSNKFLHHEKNIYFGSRKNYHQTLQG